MDAEDYESSMTCMHARRGLGWSSFGRLLIQVKYHKIIAYLKYKKEEVLEPDLTFGFAHCHSAGTTRPVHSCQSDQIVQKQLRWSNVMYGKSGETGEGHHLHRHHGMSSASSSSSS